MLKLSQAEVDKRDKRVGWIAKEPYYGAYKKRLYMCPKCNKSYMVLPSGIWSGNTKSCNSCGYITRGKSIKLTKQEVDNKDKEAGWYSDDVYQGSLIKRKYYCPICGHITYTTPANVWQHRVKSCLQCGQNKNRQDNIPDIKLADKKDKDIGWQAIGPYINSQTKREYECPICKKHIFVKPTRLWTNKQQACGNCKSKRNGHFMSRISLSLRPLLPIGAIPNYLYGNKHIKNGAKKSIDWAFVCKGKKIALEYNEWFWHGYKIKEDRKRYKDFINNNWCVIIIQAHNNIPTQKQIDKALNLINNGRKKITITLKGWGHGNTLKDSSYRLQYI